jgi:hypothetical protein
MKNKFEKGLLLFCVKIYHTNYFKNDGNRDKLNSIFSIRLSVV